MRKNWINWKRSPKCSFCEICCASYVFFLLVWIRTLISVTHFDAGELATYRHPVLPTLWYEDGEWTGHSELVNEQAQNFMEYNRYPTNMEDPLGPRTRDYNSLTDFAGFTGFVPTQCMANASFVVPRVESPVIALVGDTTEPAMASMVDYMEALIGF